MRIRKKIAALFTSLALLSAVAVTSASAADMTINDDVYDVIEQNILESYEGDPSFQMMCDAGQDIAEKYIDDIVTSKLIDLYAPVPLSIDPGTYIYKCHVKHIT